MYHWMTQAEIQRFLAHLRREERSPGTLAKYRRDLLAFAARLPHGGRVDKEQVLAWKGEYLALLAAARRRGSQRLYHVMQTLGATGIRVSELVFVTVEALAAGRALVHCKGKRRAVLLPQKLCRALQGYCRARGITAGPVFVTRTGRPVDRSNLWREMQALCSRAGVEARKVFPHNFRHLFARAFYALDKDLAKLADLLGHASIETTRIYIMESGAEHKRQVERLGLIL